MDEKLHRFESDVSGIELPGQFTCPFNYVPHQLARLAAAQVQRYVASRHDWADELQQGKMLGVLVVRQPHEGDNVGFLAAFSGNLAGSVQHSYFVPPVYDLLNPQGEFKRGEARITEINHTVQRLQRSFNAHPLQYCLVNEREARARDIAQYRTMMDEHKRERDQRRAEGNLTDDEQEQLLNQSRHEKAELKRLRQWHNQCDATIVDQLLRLRGGIDTLKQERKQLSEALQERIFHLFVVSNARGERRDLIQVFSPLGILPPAGAGECCAPRLLNYAYTQGFQPVCMAEFWWGASPTGEVRHHGHYYPACRSKCKPILDFMLQGLDVEPNTLDIAPPERPLDIVYDDQWLTVINKTAGMLTVPGKVLNDSLLTRWRQANPQATGPLVVHRLDQETSGLVVFAKDKATHRHLQQQFTQHTIHKVYTALLDGNVAHDEGVIDLPLRPDADDRPRQRVDKQCGKRAITRYRVTERHGEITRVELEPLTGRTHQLRVHASHTLGLGCPIVGDRLYGTAAQRLMLHATSITFTHPASGETFTLHCDPDF